jgi:hypothetical protein
MKRTYLVNGRNGHFAVDEHNDQNSGVSGPMFIGTRKQAVTVADALNKAYQDGREDQAADSRDLVDRAYAVGLKDGDPAGFYGGTVSRETVTVVHSDGRLREPVAIPFPPTTGWHRHTVLVLRNARVAGSEPCPLCTADPGELHQDP